MLIRAKSYLQSYISPTTQEKVSYYYSTAKTFAQQAYYSRQAQNFFSGFIQIIYYLPESLLTIKKSAETRKVVVHVLMKNAVYAGTAIGYWGYVRPLIRYVLNDGNSYREQAADYVFSSYLLRESWRITVENILNNASLSKAAASMVPESKHFKPCGHGEILIIRANIIDSNLYSIVNQGLLQIVHEIPILGPLLYWLLMPIQCGQELTEYRLVDLCMKDRREIQRRINAYNAGVGFAPTVFTFLFSQLISRYTGAESLYINHALQNVAVKLSMLASMLQDEKLPTNEPGINLFRYPQILTDAVVKDTVECITPYLKKKTASNSYPAMKRILSLSARVALGTDYSRLDSLSRVPAVNLLIGLYKTKIKTVLKYVKSLQKYTSPELGDLIPEIFLPTGVSSKDFLLGLDAIHTQYSRDIVVDLDRLMILLDLPLESCESLSVELIGRPAAQDNYAPSSTPTSSKKPPNNSALALSTSATSKQQTSEESMMTTFVLVDDIVKPSTTPASSDNKAPVLPKKPTLSLLKQPASNTYKSSDETDFVFVDDEKPFTAAVISALPTSTQPPGKGKQKRGKNSVAVKDQEATQFEPMAINNQYFTQTSPRESNSLFKTPAPQQTQTENDIYRKFKRD